MMINENLVRNYTTALFDVASDSGLEEKIFNQIHAINELIKDNNELKHIMFSPIVGDKDKEKIIDVIEKTLNIEFIVKRFLLTLLKHSRMPILSNVVDLYDRLINRKKNIKMIEIVSSKALKLEDQKWITKYLENDLNQKVKINFYQDTSIIGGIVVKCDSVVADYSIAGMLKQVNKVLKSTKIQLS